MYLEPTKRTTTTSLGFPETKSFRAYHGGTPTSVEMNVPAPRHVRKGDFGYTLYAMHRIAGRSIYRLIGGVQMFLGFELLVYICIRAPLTGSSVQQNNTPLWRPSITTERLLQKFNVVENTLLDPGAQL